MMRSLFSGVSGLRNHQTRMDVLGNNIANVNTVGFKAGRVTFQDVLSQTTQGASAAQGARGGTNPKQIGLGVGIASIDTLFTDGSFQPTGKATDLSIQGQGFFVLGDGASQYYTRAGNFDFDTQGNFGVPGTGYQVMGWTADDSGVVDTAAPISGITIPVGSAIPAKATTSITHANNLSASAVANQDTALATIDIYDSLGEAHTAKTTYAKTGNNTWTATTTIDGAAVPVVGADPLTPNSFTLSFNDDGTLTSTTPATPTLSYSPLNGAAAMSLTFNLSGLTQYGGDTSVQATGQSGYASGSMNGSSIDVNGNVIGSFTNGQTRTLAQLALATFNNPAGLTKVGSSLFSRSTNSGEPQVGTTGVGGRGTINPGTLEMSNVDLAEEFSNMVITQRGFQANSRVITTTDQMLEELTNLKR